MRHASLLLALTLCLPSAAAFAQMPPGGAAGPTEVGTIEMTRQDVPYSVTLPGRAVAYEQTDIRPQVGGAIDEILYKPGTQVKTGDPLFRISADSYEATVAQAEAELARAEVAVPQAQTTFDRYESLLGSSVTEIELESARVTLKQAEADVRAAEASLRTARVNLAHTTVTSPINGNVGVPQVSVGAVVTASQSDALATVTRLDPIYVDMMESSARILRMRQQISEGAVSPGEKLDVTLTLENGAVYDRTGEMVSPDFVVSSTTGSIGLRIQFDNPDHLILPGMFVRAKVTVGTRNAFLVPQRATTRGADGALNLWVAEDGVARQRTLTTIGSYESSWVVTEGLEEGDLAIVDGLSNLTDGAEVSGIAVTIDENGVVREAE